MPIVRVSTKGQIVIPAEMRKEFGIKPGTMIDLAAEGNAIALRPVPDDPVEASYGAFAHLESMIPGLLQDRREEREREERDLR